MNNFKKLEDRLGISWSDPDLLRRAFIHRSYLNESRESLESNEKLEFLGDSVLSLATSVYLYKKYPRLNEGDYTDIKAAIVRTESLAEAAKQINLGDYLLLSKGEEAGNGRCNINILAGCFEALIAAIFLEKGFVTAYDFIQKNLFINRLDDIVTNKTYISPKTILQELVQNKYKVLPVYKIEEEVGPDHDKVFTVSVTILDKVEGIAKGNSKKHAEEAAAKIALEKYN